MAQALEQPQFTLAAAASAAAGYGPVRLQAASVLRHAEEHSWVANQESSGVILGEARIYVLVQRKNT